MPVGYDPYQQELLEIERRRRIAQAMQMQSMEPIPTGNRMAGRFVTRISPWEGVAKLVQGALGGYGQMRAGEAERKLGTRYGEAERQASERVSQALSGRRIPEAADVPPSLGPQERSSAITSALAGHPNPAMRVMGLKTQIEQATKGEEISGAIVTGPDGKLYSRTKSGATIPVMAEGRHLTARERMEVSPAGQVYNPFAATPGQNLPVTTPHQAWQEKTKFPWEQQTERTRLGNEAARIGIERGRLFLETPEGMTLPGVGGASAPPIAAPAPIAPRLPPTPPFMPQSAPSGPQALPQPRLPAPAPQAQPSPTVGLSPKQAGARLAKLREEEPQARLALETNSANLSEMITIANSIAKSPHLGQITGAGTPMSWLPGTGAANVGSDLKTLATQIALKTLADMRAASKTGGAVGNVTEQEWPRLEGALRSLSQMQSPQKLKTQLETIVRIAKEAQQRMESVYGSEYREVQRFDMSGATRGRPEERRDEPRVMVDY